MIAIRKQLGREGRRRPRISAQGGGHPGQRRHTRHAHLPGAAVQGDEGTQGTHEGCIEQIDGLFRDSLYSAAPQLDEEGRLRADGKELDPAVQAAVAKLWDGINTDTLRELSDFDGYKREFLQLFGFEVDGVDYDAEVNPAVVIDGMV